MGTINMLEALRTLKSKAVAVIITTDKVYENQGINCNYKETDSLGGHDPYSASKACAEIATRSWHFTLGQTEQSNNIRIVTARAGNVIGGGDWCKNRINPDCMRSIYNRKNLLIRNPSSTRPWQHVLDVLYGYICLAIKYLSSDQKFESFNFGPESDNKSVLDVVSEIQKYNRVDYSITDQPSYAECNLLQLDSNKAYQLLNWKPSLHFKKAIRLTAEWYLPAQPTKNTYELTMKQVANYLKNTEI